MATRWIYFASNRQDGFQIWKIPAAGGDPLPVTRNGGHAVKETPDGKLLYYTKEHQSATTLWRVATNGGPEVQVAKSVWAEALEPVAGGVYYVTRLEPDDRRAIEFLDTARGTSTQLKTLDTPVARGLAVSPDGRVPIYASPETPRTDLMLVEGLR